MHNESYHIDTSHYIYRVIWSEEDKEYIGLCSEFPSLSYLSQSHEECFKGIVKLTSQVVQDMIENKETPPMPIMHRRYSGRFQLRITEEQHRKLYIEAHEQGISLNRYISSKLL